MVKIECVAVHDGVCDMLQAVQECGNFRKGR